ncbi:phosphatase PAP2 family protein [Arthrobacter burdickii]|jgi:membrane-associated phospholipid phosphatase|uniref:Phosphatase PAP2 family protein n=1 Tax=Arthrobacter burdickii TaxID=3035920 RepID=A0ABT8K1D8_9MICC|nr:phosphatase PAP2 family protein [Arthrobacter burdickii]MDN4610184.1 phosphatase PAP2 family protein [Arthrobacter burdickii]
MPAHQDQYVGPRDLTRWSSPIGRLLVRCVRPLARWVGPHTALLLIITIGGGVAAALTAASAEVYESVVDADGVAALDHPALDLAVSLRQDWLNAFITGYTNIGGPIGMPILAVSIMVLLAVRRRSWTPVILLPAAAFGSLLMTIAGKDAIGRLRPPIELAVPPYESSPSFPSGHSLNAVVIAGIVAYLLVLRQHRKRTRALTIVLAVLFATTMGLSRVYLGHHWLTDVLVAWTLGVAWIAVVITAHRLFLTFRLRRSALRGAPA